MRLKREHILSSCVLAVVLDSVLVGFAVGIAVPIIAFFGDRYTAPALVIVWALLSWLPTIAFLYTRSQRVELAQQLRSQSDESGQQLRLLRIAVAAAQRDVAATQRDLALANRDARLAVLELWLAEVPLLSYSSEVEVEFKFVYPLLRWLGFDAQVLRPRCPISVQIGRQDIRGEADWVVYRNSKPYVVVEAKSTARSLDAGVLGQARSYAYALGAPLFLITNGQSLQLHRRGVSEDECLLDCTVTELRDHWAQLSSALAL